MTVWGEQEQPRRGRRAAALALSGVVWIGRFNGTRTVIRVRKQFVSIGCPPSVLGPRTMIVGGARSPLAQLFQFELIR